MVARWLAFGVTERSTSGALSTTPTADHVAPCLATNTNASPPEVAARSAGLLATWTICASGVIAGACGSHSTVGDKLRFVPQTLIDFARQSHTAATLAWS